MPQVHLDCTFCLDSGNRNSCYNHPQSLFLIMPWRTKWFICRSVWMSTIMKSKKPKQTTTPPKHHKNKTQKIRSENCLWFRASNSSFSEDTVLSFLLFPHTVCSAYLTRKKLLEGKQRIHSIQKAYPCLTELWTYWAILKHAVL